MVTTDADLAAAMEAAAEAEFGDTTEEHECQRVSNEKKVKSRN